MQHTAGPAVQVVRVVSARQQQPQPRLHQPQPAHRRTTRRAGRWHHGSVAEPECAQRQPGVQLHQHAHVRPVVDVPPRPSLTVPGAGRPPRHADVALPATVPQPIRSVWPSESVGDSERAAFPEAGEPQHAGHTGYHDLPPRPKQPQSSRQVVQSVQPVWCGGACQDLPRQARHGHDPVLRPVLRHTRTAPPTQCDCVEQDAADHLLQELRSQASARGSRDD
mmetsp:Transcript_35056/g.87072  ORF Transcript_35056/g.87072 Transcript_35056/m.87072 type:complete len:222 (-) Transcript_35056:1309-1974(-)